MRRTDGTKLQLLFQLRERLLKQSANSSLPKAPKYLKKNLVCYVIWLFAVGCGGLAEHATLLRGGSAALNVRAYGTDLYHRGEIIEKSTGKTWYRPLPL